ncbi:MAG: hypothetical protein GY704_12665, partial [Phycisphaeraceae bacterium]|nr:hypothetical protein [Phycisphaeraceae bacterium]
MPSSVQTIESSGIASNRGETRFPGLRAAAVLAAIGSMTLTAAGQDYDGGNSGDFNDTLNWAAGLPGTYPDFNNGVIDILSIFGTDPINVANDIVGIGGLTNSNDLDVVFGGVGSFRFNDAS